MASVELQDLSKTHLGPAGEEIRALHRLSLHVADRELVVLVGPSGCGKTTTLRLIAGLESATGGSISIGGRCVDALPPKDRDVAMVFQNYALFPHLTVLDNMAFGLRLRRVPRAAREARVREVAELLGLEGLLRRKPDALSGGQRQRVALGRAMVRNPSVFLLDEPLSNLDAKMRVQMRLELARLHRRLAATMIYVTHDQVEAMTLGDRIVVLHEGGVQQIAPPMELYERPANLFVARFIGSPAMNTMEGTLQRVGGAWRMQPEDASQPSLPLALTAAQSTALEGAAVPPDRRLVIGVRSEHLHLREAGAQGDWTATVDLVETPGADLHVHVMLAGQPWVVRASLAERWQAGQSVGVSVEWPGVRLFDATTGRAMV